MALEISRRRAVAGAGSLLVGVSVAGCSGDGDDGEDGDGPPTVDMTDELLFEPESITVSVGDTVTWENVGSIGHSVTAYENEIPDGAEYFASGGYDSEQAAKDGYSVGDESSGDIPADGSYEHTFETAGTYEYFCIPHEGSGMVGTVDVE